MDILKAITGAIMSRGGMIAGSLNAAVQPGDDMGTQVLIVAGLVLGLIVDVVVEKRRAR